MRVSKIVIGALAIGLMLGTAASSSLAGERQQRAEDWRNARAQATPDAGMMSGDRPSVLRQCNDETASLKDYTWGDQKTFHYRSCMAQHDQPE